jgi:hypothetical protein
MNNEEIIETIDTGKYQYRIVKNNAGFESQMKYQVGMSKEFLWFPLNEYGYWLEPDAFSFGNITLHKSFPSLEEAQRVILKARVVNEPLHLVK